MALHVIEDGPVVLIRPDVEDRERFYRWMEEHSFTDVSLIGEDVLIEHKDLDQILYGLIDDGFTIVRSRS